MKTVNVKIDADLHAFLSIKARQGDTTLVRYTRKIIREFAESNGFSKKLVPIPATPAPYATQEGYINDAGEMIFPEN